LPCFGGHKLSFNEVGFYEPTTLKVHPLICRVTELTTMPFCLELSAIYFSACFYPNERRRENSPYSEGL